jgi:hypothetical protein
LYERRGRGETRLDEAAKPAETVTIRNR